MICSEGTSCSTLPSVTPMAPVVATTMNCELASSAEMGMPTISEYRPLMGLTPARMAVAIASGMVTKATVMPAVRSAPRLRRPALTGAAVVVMLSPCSGSLSGESRALPFCLQSLTAQVDGLPVLFDQFADLAFRLDEADMTQQQLARLRRFRLLANHLDHLQHVQQDPGVVATGMPEHIESGAEQLAKSNRLQHQAQSAVSIGVMGASGPVPDELHQAIRQMVQARHCRERVIDRRRHSADGHFGQLVDRIFDILGGRAPIPDLEGVAKLSRQLLVDATGGPDQGHHRIRPDKMPRFV